MSDVLVIDGSQGEGGGQMLRTSLALSMITGIPVRLENIRARRSKPGLLRQHLTATRAAGAISSATMRGAQLRSTTLDFEPGPITPGTYEFAVGTAGSAGLVFQTVLPALMIASGPSSLTLSGGTHNDRAPSFDYIARAFAPQLAKLGPALSLSLLHHGFYPAGGGSFTADIVPCAQEKLQRISLLERGEQLGMRAVAVVANLPEHVARRELEELRQLLSLPQDALRAEVVEGHGPGNAAWLEVEYEHVTELFTAFGRKGRPAEMVSQDVVDEAKGYLATSAPVGEHLADQLLLPMALAGHGEIVCTAPSQHTLTQIEVIEKFLPVEFLVERREQDRSWKIVVES